jgi:N-6 DNA Methylase
MLTRERVASASVLEVFRDLGYPVDPVAVDAAEWRRGGVSIPWNGEARLQLAARLGRFDLFLLEGSVSEEWIVQFMRSYAAYNQLTKSVLIYQSSIFDLGPDHSLRRLDVQDTPHAVDRLNLLACGDDLPRIFDRALDRESVTRQFFQRFRAAVRDVSTALAAFEEPKEACDGEALLILSRLLFLSFIQEKGWLNGERRFLVDKLAHEIRRGRDFFSTVLAPLFFGCLNTPLHERTLAARRLGRIPYLNGGLFEPSAFEQRHPDLTLPNQLMQEVIEEVFEKFDFRIEETDTSGTHVDPEMLGKVFESLMAEDERASSGSFYTPKEVVDVLSERAVGEWLGDGGVERLEQITVLDPACGSGAFLLSALSTIERHYKRLLGSGVPRDLRQRIVSRNLFGVDLKPEAVRLCELRLWLAIVAAADTPVELVQPLPNLDRNILQGNSLLSPIDFLGDARADIYGQWVVALHAQRDLLERYRTASHGQRPVLYRVIRGNDQRLASDLLAKSIDAAEAELQQLTAPQRDLFGRAVTADAGVCRALQERIAECKRMLERVEDGALDFFAYDVHFAHVMAAGGFHVVVGNPPWVRNSRIDARARRMYADRYALFRAAGDGTAFHQPDLSVAFFERALSLTAPGGVTALLMPAKIANAAYAAPLRRAATRRARVVAIDDWSDDPRRRRWFEADTFPLGIVLARDGKQAATRVSAAGESFELSDLAIGSEWALVPPEVGAIARRLRGQFPPLERALNRRPFMGVKTGDNRSFFVSDEEVREFHIPASALCRCVRGRDLQRWSVGKSQWMLWPPRDGWKTPPSWLKRFAETRGMAPEEFRLSFVRPEHVGIKVAWKDLSRGVAAAVLPDAANVDGCAYPLVPNQTLYAIDAATLDEAYVLSAVLNSTIAGALLVCTAERAKDAHYRYFGRTVGALPLPELDLEWDRLVRAARRAHRGNDVAADIDKIVARMYGVSDGELALLRAFLARRLGAR